MESRTGNQRPPHRPPTTKSCGCGLPCALSAACTRYWDSGTATYYLVVLPTGTRGPALAARQAAEIVKARSSNLHVDDGGLLVDALHDAGEHLAGPELVEGLDRAGLHEVGHDGLPLHRRRHLLLEDLLDLGGV